jgi:ABC-type multidrug transport system fused ATPase/permease subunit
MVNRVMNTKLKFFEVNTHGRILNRFSKDIGVLDNLVFTFLDMLDVRLFSYPFTILNLVYCEMLNYSDYNCDVMPLGYYYSWIVAIVFEKDQTH